MILKYAMSLALATLMTVGIAKAEESDKKYDTGIIPSPHIMVPTGKVVGEVVLISDIGGWGDKENAVAQTLLAKGSMVIGIDYPSLLKSLNDYDVSQNDGCIYMVSDIEALSQQVQRSVADSAYELPIIAGVGAGGTMALAIAAQTPDATVSQTLAVDPAAGIALKKDLCTPAEKVKVGDNLVIGLMDGALPDPFIASFTPAAP